jgi:hypothetical protein
VDSCAVTQRRYINGPGREESLHSAHGLVGGEAHDSYVIHLRKGEMMTVEVSWRREHTEQGDNHAEFFVSELPNFGADGKKFGKEI